MKKRIEKTKENFLSSIKPKKSNLGYWIVGIVVVIVLFYLISGSINISVKDSKTGELRKETLRGALFTGDDDTGDTGDTGDDETGSSSSSSSGGGSVQYLYYKNEKNYEKRIWEILGGDGEGGILGWDSCSNSVNICYPIRTDNQGNREDNPNTCCPAQTNPNKPIRGCDIGHDGWINGCTNPCKVYGLYKPTSKLKGKLNQIPIAGGYWNLKSSSVITNSFIIKDSTPNNDKYYEIYSGKDKETGHIESFIVDQNTGKIYYKDGEDDFKLVSPTGLQNPNLLQPKCPGPCDIYNVIPMEEERLNTNTISAYYISCYDKSIYSLNPNFDPDIDNEYNK